MKKQRGFNMIELLITIVVGSILIAIAVPAFKSFVQNNRISTINNNLVTSFTLARSEAIKRRRAVSLCNSSDQLTCTGNWTDGWIAFVDASTPGTVDVGTDTVLRVWDGLDGGATLTKTGGTLWIQFDRLGVANANTCFDLTIPDGTVNQTRSVSLFTSGRAEARNSVCPP